MIYGLFFLAVISTTTDEHWLVSNHPYGWGKTAVWLAWLAFFSYTFYCSEKENFIRSLKKMYPFHWFRQIGIDLGIGLILFGGIVWLNSGSFLLFLLWLIPFTLFGNLASLVYLAANYDSILSHLL